MKTLIAVYKLVSVLLIIVDLTMLLLIVASMVSRGRIIQYGEPGPGSFDDQLYNYFIDCGEVSMFFLLINWSVLTLLLVGIEKMKVRSFYVKLGSIGFLLTVIYLRTDPFGLWAYYSD